MLSPKELFAQGSGGLRGEPKSTGKKRWGRQQPQRDLPPPSPPPPPPIDVPKVLPNGGIPSVLTIYTGPGVAKGSSTGPISKSTGSAKAAGRKRAREEEEEGGEGGGEGGEGGEGGAKRTKRKKGGKGSAGLSAPMRDRVAKILEAREEAA